MMRVFGCALFRNAELDDGVLVDIVRKGGGWVEDRNGQAGVQVDSVSWWGINVTRGNRGIGKSCV